MKKFSQQAAANFVPLLARIILFLAFVPVGWHHAMEMGQFSGDAGARLRELGVVSAEQTSDDFRHLDGDFGGTATASSTGIVRVRAPIAQDTPPVPLVAADAAGYQARALHELTLTLDRLAERAGRLAAVQAVDSLVVVIRDAPKPKGPCRVPLIGVRCEVALVAAGFAAGWTVKP